jgi:aromatic ring-opening dioxygenase catalytic subunit (LigB family)
MGAMRGGDTARVEADSKAFDEWLAETVQMEPSQREARLAEWTKAPAARACHPREEHLLPLMVIAGAALEDAGTAPYRDVVMGAHVSAHHFG